MEKQTAVEWLVGKLSITFQTMYSEEIEQAKAMEKEQIIKANRDGVDMVINEEDFVTGKQYYNETYGGDK